MEKLALSHANKFKKLRIENETLSGKLNTEKTNLSACLKNNKKSDNWTSLYKNIIEKQKSEIARISKNYDTLCRKILK